MFQKLPKRGSKRGDRQPGNFTRIWGGGGEKGKGAEDRRAGGRGTTQRSWGPSGGAGKEIKGFSKSDVTLGGLRKRKPEKKKKSKVGAQHYFPSLPKDMNRGRTVETTPPDASTVL